MSTSDEREDGMRPQPAGETSLPRPFHILVVDDERDVRQVLCDLIGLSGYRATGAAGGQAALEVLKRDSVDLVLTDLMMPGMNGWQLLEAVKKMDSRIPVVVITGFISEQAETILTSRHVDGYLAKPVDQRRLTTLLRALLFPQNLGRPAEVVVVDDDADILEAIDASLSRRGLFVTRFLDLDEAEAYIRKTPPDLALVDLRFPGASGFSLCQAIRSDPETARMPILILTANPSRENVLQAVRLQVHGFIAKPFDPNGLAERVLKVLRQVGRAV